MKKKKSSNKKKHHVSDKRNKEVGKKASEKKTKLAFVFNLIFYVIMLGIFFGAGIMAIMQQQDKSLNGYRMFGVLSDSMVSPGNKIKDGGFRSGDVIIIKETPPKDIKVGDIITYRPSTNPNNKSTNYLTHRVVKVQNGLKGEKGYYFTTRGDANTTDDMPMSERALVGKVVGRIPKVGGVLSFIKDNLILSIVFVLSVAGFFWVIKMYILADDEEPKKRKEIKEVSKRKSSSNSKTSKSKSSKEKKISKDKGKKSSTSKSHSHSKKTKSEKSKKSKKPK